MAKKAVSISAPYALFAFFQDDEHWRTDVERMGIQRAYKGLDAI